MENPTALEQGQSQALYSIKIPNWGQTAAGSIVSAITSPVDFITSLAGGDNIARMAGCLGPNSGAPSLIDPIKPIDVHKNFAWTGSRSEAPRRDLPYLQMREKIVDRSSRLQNLMYNTFALSQTGLLQAGIAAAGVGGAVKAFQSGGSTKQKLLKGVTSLAVGATGAYYADQVIGAAEGFLSGDSYSEQLAAYQGLYSTKPTGFVYKFPFVKVQGKIDRNVSSNWGSAQSFGLAGLLQGVSKDAGAKATEGSRAGGVIEGAANLGGNILQGVEMANNALSYIFAGAFTEKAKSYNYPQDDTNHSCEINFYLFNNISWVDTVRNWQLVFGLQYQNLPNRLNRLIVTPPVIYEAIVPGYYYSMYCYISRLEVDFIGSSIMVDMPIKFAGDPDPEAPKNASTGESSGTQEKTFRIMVPEAYKVSMALTSLVPESQNLFYQANARNSQRDFIT